MKKAISALKFWPSFFVLALLISGPKVFADQNCPNCKADFAILTGSNVWEGENSVIRDVLGMMGKTYENVTFQQVSAGYLGKGHNRKFRSFIEAGGDMYPRAEAFVVKGNIFLREFVKNGGGFVGFCAGAYHAAEKMIWAFNPTGPNGKFEDPDYVIQDYELHGFAHMTARGPLEWNPNMDANPYQLADVNPRSDAMNTLRLKGKVRLYLTNGPTFNFDYQRPPKNLDVWLTFSAPEENSKGSFTSHGKPGVLSFEYGEGKVVLSAFHPSQVPGGSDGRLSIKRTDPGRLPTIAERSPYKTLLSTSRNSLNILAGMLRSSIFEMPLPLTNEELNNSGGRRPFCKEKMLRFDSVL